MEHTVPYEFIERSSGILIFILSLTLLMSISGQQGKLTKIIKENLRDKKEMYVQYQDDAYENNVTYKELIGTLLSDKLEYDVEVEGYTFLKENHHYVSVNISTIPKRDYKKSYVYATNGTITKVIYQAI